MSTSVTTPLPGPKPMIEEPQSRAAIAMLWVFVVGPFVALFAAVPMCAGAARRRTPNRLAVVRHPFTRSVLLTPSPDESESPR